MDNAKGGFIMAAKIFLALAICFWFSSFFNRPINLYSADLGRHLKNGEIFVENFNNEGFKNKILSANYYARDHADFPFLNHHWLAGVIFYLILKLAGFKGLSVFFLLLNLAAFSIFFRLAAKKSGFYPAAAYALAFTPLMAMRAEIRPEIFSYLLMGSFLLLFQAYENRKISAGWLIFLLFSSQALWTNLHAYSFLGLVIIGSFLLESMIRQKEKIKVYLPALSAGILACLVNPNGAGIIRYFSLLYQDSAYKVLENQSFWFLEKLRIDIPEFLFFKFLLIASLASFLALLFKRKAVDIPYLSINSVLLLLALLAMRDIAIFSLFSFVFVSQNIFMAKDVLADFYGDGASRKKSYFISAAVIAAVFLFSFSFYSRKTAFAENNLGMPADNSRAADFFKTAGIRGPIFNNYDIGGYLIFHLFPQEKIFVDNRPEAYDDKFFTETYIPMQEREEVWEKMDEKYGFNAIFFYRRDTTPWGQPFLIRRIKDPGWSPVFVDDYALILLKRNKENGEIIKKFGLPEDIFIVKNNKSE